MPSEQKSSSTGTSLLGVPAQPPVQRKNDTGIPSHVLGPMEHMFQRDFSAVRVHRQSAEAKPLGALAFARGNEIHFAPGQFDPDSARGRGMLAHELAHVVQQADARVQPTTTVAGNAVNDNPQLEREADAAAARARGMT